MPQTLTAQQFLSLPTFCRQAWIAWKFCADRDHRSMGRMLSEASLTGGQKVVRGNPRSSSGSTAAAWPFFANASKVQEGWANARATVLDLHAWMCVMASTATTNTATRQVLVGLNSMRLRRSQ